MQQSFWESMNREDCYGIIPLKKSENSYFVLIIQHKNGLFWAFPKGHAEPGELPKETAQRELFEETGLSISKFLSDTPITENYRFKSGNREIHKWVYYYLAEVAGEIKLDDQELTDYKWVPLSEAESLLTYDEAKGVCRQASKSLSLLS